MNNHPETITVTLSSYLPAGTQLRRLEPHEIIQEGDYFTSAINEPGFGLIPVFPKYLKQLAGSLTFLITYRLIELAPTKPTA